MTSRQPTPGSPAHVARWVVATAVAGTLVIAVGAFWLSFTALTDLAARAGIPSTQAWVWPLIVDGIIVVATVAVVALAPHGRRATLYPWSLLIAGALISVAGNAIHAVLPATRTLPGRLSAVISAVPPVVLLAITHLTVVLTRHRPARQAPRPSPAANTAGAGRAQPRPKTRRTSQAAQSAQDRRARVREAAVLRAQGWSNRAIARHLAVHPSTVGRWLTGSGPATAAADD